MNNRPNHKNDALLTPYNIKKRKKKNWNKKFNSRFAKRVDVRCTFLADYKDMKMKNKGYDSGKKKIYNK